MTRQFTWKINLMLMFTKWTRIDQSLLLWIDFLVEYKNENICLDRVMNDSGSP